MTFHAVVDALVAALDGPLPGSAAHARMAPLPPRTWPGGAPPRDLRHAAGLLLVYPIDQRAHVVLTVRSHAVRHAGQVSLPGGVIERGETMQAAALREAHEEIGLERDGLRMIGALSPIDITVSGFRLHPIVAARQTRPDLKPTDSEVARILEVDVAALTSAAHFSRRTMSRDGRTLEVPTFDIDGAAIWGATAMVLAEFLTLLGWPGPPDE